VPAIDEMRQQAGRDQGVLRLPRPESAGELLRRQRSVLAEDPYGLLVCGGWAAHVRLGDEDATTVRVERRVGLPTVILAR
jgi:hypothetical protein